MVTYMPYRHYGQCAEVLTDQHLDSQCWMIGDILEGKANDTPIPGMWRGHLYQLVLFGLRMTHEQCQVRRRTSMDWKRVAPFVEIANNGNRLMPPWWGDPWVHRSHRSRLLNLDMHGEYDDLWPGTPLKMPLIWPQLDDTDSRGYRLVITPKHNALLDSRAYRLPAGLRLTRTLEVVSDE